MGLEAHPRLMKKKPPSENNLYERGPFLCHYPKRSRGIYPAVPRPFVDMFSTEQYPDFLPRCTGHDPGAASVGKANEVRQDTNINRKSGQRIGEMTILLSTEFRFPRGVSRNRRSLASPRDDKGKGNRYGNGLLRRKRRKLLFPKPIGQIWSSAGPKDYAQKPGPHGTPGQAGALFGYCRRCECVYSGFVEALRHHSCV